MVNSSPSISSHLDTREPVWSTSCLSLVEKEPVGGVKLQKRRRLPAIEVREVCRCAAESRAGFVESAAAMADPKPLYRCVCVCVEG